MMQRQQEEFADKHARLLPSLRNDNLSLKEAAEAAQVTDGFVKMHQIPHKRKSSEFFGEWTSTSCGNAGGSLHRWAGGDAQPDTPFSARSGGLARKPDQILEEKMAEWCRIRKRGDKGAITCMSKVLR